MNDTSNLPRCVCKTLLCLISVQGRALPFVWLLLNILPLKLVFLHRIDENVARPTTVLSASLPEFIALKKLKDQEAVGQDGCSGSYRGNDNGEEATKGVPKAHKTVTEIAKHLTKQSPLSVSKPTYTSRQSRMCCYLSHPCHTFCYYIPCWILLSASGGDRGRGWPREDIQVPPGHAPRVP